MNFIRFVKNELTTLPFWLGNTISKVPFGLRPGVGKIYSERKGGIDIFDGLDSEKKEKFIFLRVKAIVEYAYKEIDFYHQFYNLKGFKPDSLTSFDDLNLIPIVRKSDLQKFELNQRSNPVVKSSRENTGGSSGKPLELLIEPSSIPHEWAHMHKVWAKVGFKQSDLRLVFSGRSSISDILQYDSARHQVNVDTYIGWDKVADKLLEQYEILKPNYLHGYPSAIFDFVLWLEANNHPLLNILKASIKGMLLGSEYPNPVLREKVERLIGCESVSWYGHTERCVLAYEKDSKQVYCPFHTYGYTESVEVEGHQHLVSTSYYNFAHPLIRYDTEDVISKNESKILNSFVIEQGRVGEFILDKNENKVFLTALIFGRHHKLFEYCSSVQVHQIRAGEALILYVPRKDIDLRVEDLFDSSNVEISFSFMALDSPVKTVSGKSPLLVKKYEANITKLG